MINTLTLNPAADKILFVDSLEKHITNRAKKSALSVGGKGTHVSMTLKLLGVDNRAFGICYGGTGKKIVDELQYLGLITRFLNFDRAESRTNYVLVEASGVSTTISEKGVSPNESEIAALIALMEREISDGDCLVISGDASNCSDPYIYNRIIRELRHKNLKVVLDASGKTLRNGLEAAPYLIKPNRDEMEGLCGFTIRSTEDAVKAVETLSRYAVHVIALSLGKDGAVVKIGERIYKCTPPDVEIKNTAGCGDSFLAGMLMGLERGLPDGEVLKLATAVSSAAAACEMSVGFDPGLAEKLMETAEVELIK